mgnify:CR=1 FL=1
MIKFFQIILLLSLTSCGFQVIYRESEKSADISYVDELAAIRIQKVRNRLGQEFQNNLYDILNPDYVKAEPKYLLIARIDTIITPTFITQTGSSGRNNMILNVTYTLKSAESGDVIASGRTSVNDNYDVRTNRYGTYVTEEYVKSNLTKIAAQNIRNSIVNDLIETRKAPKKKDDWINEKVEPEKVEKPTSKN